MKEKPDLVNLQLRAMKFEEYLERKRVVRDGRKVGIEKRIKNKHTKNEAAISQGEDVIRQRLVTAYEVLDDRRRKSIEDLDLVIPGNFEFSEHEIIAMDSDIVHPYDTWEIPFLPKLLTDEAFDYLVSVGVFEKSSISELNEQGEKTGCIINKYRKP